MIYEELKAKQDEQNPNRYLERAISLVMEQRTDNAPVYIVWFSKTLQNWKALLSTTVPDGLYYEVTYDGDKQQAYVDTYQKISNEVVPNWTSDDLEDSTIPPLQDLPPYAAHLEHEI